LDNENFVFKISRVRKDFSLPEKEESKFLHYKDINIKRNYLTLITGNTGLGKTTLLNILGLMDDFSFNDENSDVLFYPDLERKPISYRSINQKKIKNIEKIRYDFFGFMFQQDHLIDSMSGWENVVMPLIIRNKNISFNKAKNVAENLFLEYKFDEMLESNVLDRSPATFSGGQRQRTALIRSLIHEPSVILADEPFASVNKSVIDDIKRVFKTLLNKNKTSIIMVVHDTHEEYFDEFEISNIQKIHLIKKNYNEIIIGN